MRVILGDNPFFDINHKTGGLDRGFQKEAMEQVVAEFVSSEHGTFLLSDHLDLREKILEVLSKFADETFSVALISPVPHTINAAVANRGYKALLPMTDFRSMIFLCLGLSSRVFGRISLARYFMKKAIKIFVRNQTQEYFTAGVTISHFGLHNVFTDMLLASRNLDVLNSFIEAVKELYMEPILLTQNTGPLVALKELGGCVICGSINPLGYMMSPGQKETERILTAGQAKHEIWAMQILAGGTSELKMSLDYLNSLGIKNLVYATSKKERVRELFSLIEEV